MSRTSLIAGLFASTIALGALTAPASAGGSLSINIQPTDPESAQMMGIGLGIYQLVNDLEDGSISQDGMNNMAGMIQNGTSNVGIIEQHGDNHNATLQQNGNGNSYGIFQFGNGANDHVMQNGNGNSGLTFGFGW